MDGACGAGAGAAAGGAAAAATAGRGGGRVAASSGSAVGGSGHATPRSKPQQKAVPRQRTGTSPLATPKPASAARQRTGGRVASAPRQRTGGGMARAAAAGSYYGTNSTPAGGGSGVSNTGDQQRGDAGAGGASYYGRLDAVDSPLVSEQTNNHAAPTHPALVDREVRMALDWQHMGPHTEDVDMNDLDLDFGFLFEEDK